MTEVSVTVTTTAWVVCPKCGELIKVKIVGFSENKPEGKKDD